MEGFVGEEDFKLDALGNREPVEALKDGSDVITGMGVGEETGSRVFDVFHSHSVQLYSFSLLTTYSFIRAWHSNSRE